MAYEEVLRSISLDAAASITEATGVPGQPGSSEPNSGKQYRWVKITGAHQAGLATAAANERVIGVLQNKPQVVGMASTVAMEGISLAEAGGTVAAGDGIKVDSNGRSVTWVAGTDDEGLRVGTAVTAAASGQLFSVLIRII